MLTKFLYRYVINGVVLGLCLGVMAIPARAVSIDTEYVDMNLASGGSFVGTVTFADNYTEVVGVSGTLYGYSPSIQGYVGGGASDPISSVYTEGGTYPIGYNWVSSGGNVFGTYLMDAGTCYSGYCNWIDFSYDYTNAPALTFAPGATLDSSDYPADGVGYGYYADPMTSGSISPVPEPSPLSFLALGAVALAGYSVFRRRQGVEQISAA